MPQDQQFEIPQELREFAGDGEAAAVDLARVSRRRAGREEGAAGGRGWAGDLLEEQDP